MIAIEKNRSMVSIGSSNSPQISFEADGIAKTETNDRGRIVTTTATADNNGIAINYEGERMNDFYVTFAPGRNDELKVTRRIYIGDKNQQVTVSSVYDKINTVAEWPPVTNGPGYGYGNNTAGVNDFYIPNGTQLTTSLRSTINTNASQPGDRFTMDVISPSRYSGAIIEGRVTEAGNSGRISGRANISLDFDTITLNGRTYRFAGIVDGATAANGDTVTVNNEGVIRDNNQATNTAARAGIGAVLGAIIGAVAGGREGAAIGAGVGAGVGAGSVLVAGRDKLVLDTGSTFNITSTGPRNVGAVRY